MSGAAPVRLRRLAAGDVQRAAPTPVDAATLGVAGGIVDDVRRRGVAAVREHALRLDGLAPSSPLVFDRAALAAAARELDAELGGAPARTPEGAREGEPDGAPDGGPLALLERTAARVRQFALAQRASFGPCSVVCAGLRATQHVVPVVRAGCYAPGGRYPLPSSVLMTAVTARAAGVAEVIVATPRPSTLMLAAAHVAGADAVLAAGGAQAIAALALGAGVPRVDLVVGPGNRYATAAKQLLFGEVGVDLPAGPSELVVVADGAADPRLVALDLAAQAEHDPDARPILVAVDPSGRGDLVAAVEAELARALTDLPTAHVARAALAAGFVVSVPDAAAAQEVVARLAPEHLQLALAGAAAFAREAPHFGAAFIGERAAEVLGDYGAGPNHVLPTGGAARWSGGLSVHTFLRIRTSLEALAGHEHGVSAEALARDAAALARIEGLAAHARAAEARASAAQR